MPFPVPGISLAFAYDIPLGSFVYRGELVLPGGYGINYNAVDLQITRTAIRAQVVAWSFPGGQMQDCAPMGPERRAEGTDAAALRSVLEPRHRDALHDVLPALEAALDAGDLWAPDGWQARALRLGIPRRAGHDDARVAWAEAEHLDLWPSPLRFAEGSGDPGAERPPVLRLGRTSDALLWPEAGRSEPVAAGTPAGDATIRRRCGGGFADVAAWFAADRADRFPTDAP